MREDAHSPEDDEEWGGEPSAMTRDETLKLWAECEAARKAAREAAIEAEKDEDEAACSATIKVRERVNLGENGPLVA